MLNMGVFLNYLQGFMNSVYSQQFPQYNMAPLNFQSTSTSQQSQPQTLQGQNSQPQKLHYNGWQFSSRAFGSDGLQSPSLPLHSSSSSYNTYLARKESKKGIAIFLRLKFLASPLWWWWDKQTNKRVISCWIKRSKAVPGRHIHLWKRSNSPSPIEEVVCLLDKLIAFYLSWSMYGAESYFWKRRAVRWMVLSKEYARREGDLIHIEGGHGNRQAEMTSAVSSLWICIWTPIALFFFFLPCNYTLFKLIL